ncbi:hypothetical protein [Streptomyces sp. NRRL F-5053]|uniref:hypothetical protein n=1 Tax=Streptomyces sp. NRRL F-5053 TaxID=1463854 RepID=UPI0005669F9B
MEVLVSRTLTVGQLVHQLQTLDPDQPVFLAINPDWPFAHGISQVVTAADGPSNVVYIAENGQEGYLPTTARAELDWSWTLPEGP